MNIAHVTHNGLQATMKLYETDSRKRAERGAQRHTRGPSQQGKNAREESANGSQSQEEPNRIRMKNKETMKVIAFSE